MSGEIWQFLLIGGIGLMVAYPLRRTAEGEVATAARFKDLEERD